MRHAAFIRAFACALVLVAASFRAQAQRVPVAAPVTYVSGTTAYIGAGRLQGIEAGDTVLFYRSLSLRTRSVIEAVSSTSSSARLNPSDSSVAVGDSAVVQSLSGPPFPAQGSRNDRRTRPLAGARFSAGSSPEITGRVALQFAGLAAEGGGWTLIRPALVTRLNIGGLFGGGFAFSLNGRSYAELTDRPGSFQPEGQMRFRMYELSLAYDAPGSALAFGAGRLAPAFVAGLGVFDGGYVSVRSDRLTAGILGGSQPDYLTSGVDTRMQKVALFINYKWGSPSSGPADMTLAYARQMFRGTLDRDFLYLQSSASLGPRVFLYQSTEIDLHKTVDGTPTGAFRVSSTFVTLSCMPTDWLSTNAGYDATRPVTYLETSPAGIDTLLDYGLRQGLRASATVRLPWQVSVTAITGYRFKTSMSGQARSFGGTLRANTLLIEGLGGDVRYTRFQNPFGDGTELTGSVDIRLNYGIAAAFQVSRLLYTILGNTTEHRTIRTGATLSWRMARSWFVLLNGDQAWGSDPGAVRIFAELGFHF